MLSITAIEQKSSDGVCCVPLLWTQYVGLIRTCYLRVEVRLVYQDFDMIILGSDRENARMQEFT